MKWWRYCKSAVKECVANRLIVGFWWILWICHPRVCGDPPSLKMNAQKPQKGIMIWKKPFGLSLKAFRFAEDPDNHRIASKARLGSMQQWQQWQKCNEILLFSSSRSFEDDGFTTLFENFIFCPKSQLWFSGVKKLVKMLWFWTF